MGLVGAYTIVKIFIPFRWYQRDFLTYLVLAADVLCCASLPFLTGGLASAFLLYSLNPILTISLLLHRKVALGIAGLSSLAITASHLFSTRIGLPTAPVLAGEYLGVLIIYIMVCFLAALLPFFINVNFHRRIEEKATVEERNRLAQELHDSLAQDLGYLNLKIKLVADSILSRTARPALAELNDLKLAIDDMYEGVKKSIDLLRGKTLGSIGLIPTLAGHIHEFGEGTGIDTELFVADGQIEFSALAQLQLVRAIEEVLTNVRRHANASKVEVRIETDGKWTEAIISDDGRGFDRAAYQAQGGGHFGLKVIKQRMESLGGSMRVISGPGRGTKIVLRIPMGKGGG